MGRRVYVGREEGGEGRAFEVEWEEEGGEATAMTANIYHGCGVPSAWEKNLLQWRPILRREVRRCVRYCARTHEQGRRLTSTTYPYRFKPGPSDWTVVGFT